MPERGKFRGVRFIGYLGPPSKWKELWEVDLTFAEAKRVQTAFNPERHGCPMDVAAELYPGKLRIYEG